MWPCCVLHHCHQQRMSCEIEEKAKTMELFPQDENCSQTNMQTSGKGHIMYIFVLHYTNLNAPYAPKSAAHVTSVNISVRH